VGKGTGDGALDLLAGMLGAEIVATGPVDSPLPVAGHCSRCGSSTTRYGPAGSPLCDQCRDDEAWRPAKTDSEAESA
jgi:hypothetical protein